MAGAALLFAAKFIPREILAAQIGAPVPSALHYCTRNEFEVIRATADRIIGEAPAGRVSAGAVDVARRADSFLATTDPEIQEQFHLLLTLFNARLFTFLFDFRTSSFIDMAPEDQDSYLEDWMTSRLSFRRTGFMALKRLCTSMFYTDSRSWEDFGYTPVSVAGARE